MGIVRKYGLNKTSYLIVFGLFESAALVNSTYPSPMRNKAWCEGYRQNLYNYTINWNNK